MKATVRRTLRVLTILAFLASMLPITEARAAQPCGDVQLIWARGTNMAIGDFDFTSFDGALRGRIGVGVSYSAYQLGQDAGFGGFDYPAGGADLSIAVDNFAPFLPDGAYANSVAQGKSELVAYLADRAALCPNEVFVLGGWSQGAHVIGDGLPLLAAAVRARIAFVALFGDPKYNTGNLSLPSLPLLPSVPFPAACAFGLKPWIRGSAPCWISGGMFSPRDPYLPSDVELRVGSWCREGDPACDGSIADMALSFDEHTKYFDPLSDAAVAALEAAVALTIFLPGHAQDFDVSQFQFASGATGADLAIVFDTTGSMGGAIADAKAQATQLAQTWLTNFPNGRVALVEYKDQGDPFVARVDQGLTANVADFQTAVNGLSASGGGDIPEAMLSGLMTALNGLDWRDGATKTAVVIGDAPGKDPEPITNFTRPQVVQRALEIDPVAIYGVNVSGLTGVTAFMDPIAAGTAGDVFVLEPGQTLSDALFEVLDVVAFSPVATLHGPYIAQTGTAITFRTNGSFDADGTLVSYEWDFDGNGTADQTTTTSSVSHTYPGAFHGFAAVRVISSDGGSALATAEVTVDGVGLGNLLPIAPPSASATVSGANEVTVSWTPAASDRADGYKIYRADGTLVGMQEASDPDSLVIGGLDLSQPIQFQVVASNGYGQSGAAVAPPVGGSSAWSPSVRVNDDATTTLQVYPNVALGPNGSAIAVWQDYRTTPSIDVYAARRDPATGAWSANARVNDVATGEQYKPSVAVDANSNAYAAWVDWRNGRSDIYFSKRSAATGQWSANVRINTSTNFGSQDTPAIAVSPSGDAIAVWYRVANNKNNIWSARLPAGGTTWGPEIRVTSDQAAGKQSPDVAFGPNGIAYAVWMQPAVNNADIWFASLPAGSSTWSTNTKVSDDPGTAFQGQPDIAVDGSSNVLVAWNDWRTDPHQLRVRKRSAAGAWAPSVLLASDGGNSPSLAIRSDGRAYLAWHDGSFGTFYPRLWGRMYDPATTTWSPAERIDTNGPDHGARNPAAAMDGTRLVVLWDNGLSIPSGENDNDILARVRAP